MSTFTYLLAAVAVVAVLSGRAECRPQTPETKDVEVVGDEDQAETQPQPLPFWFGGEYGAVAGEVLTSTGDLFVDKKKKKNKKQRSGPSASALVAGPPAEASVGVGVSAGLTLVPAAAKVELVASP